MQFSDFRLCLFFIFFFNVPIFKKLQELQGFFNFEGRELGLF